jgi:hypothetical protein
MLLETFGRSQQRLSRMVPPGSTRREALQALGAAVLCNSPRDSSRSDTFSFWVLGLLKPKQLCISPLGESRLHYTSPVDASILEPGRTLLVSRESVPLRCTGPEGAPVNFALEVPRVLRRPYFGTLAIEWRSGVLIADVTMDRETAVNSITGAELPISRTGDHALMAQGVVARSFLTATRAPRHSEAFFCDTTHCQFLRSPAPPSSAVARAVAETKGVVLFFRDAVLTAYYSAACGGFTEGGLRNGYLYQRVSCETCHRLSLSRRGHGWGLCQKGAIDLSRKGCSWPEILTMYFPNTSFQNS